MPLAPGAQLGPYEVKSLLGSGGMGDVYRARDTKLNRDVALKVLPDVFSLDPERLARFKREAQVLAALNHPNIGAIYGFEDADPSTSSGQAAVQALVLELVEGPTLADRIAEGPLPLDEAMPVAKQIAEALEAAHEQAIIHRDLKPANIKVTPDGRIKVLDFGLAKMLESDPKSSSLTMSPTLSVHATYAGTILGTAAYMSPEQARGKPVDRRTDVWAFGCVLYEMLTGRQSFVPGETVSDAIVSVLSREPNWDALPADTPAPIRRLLRRCLQKDPQKRLPHIGSARIEIDETLSGSVPDMTVAPGSPRHAVPRAPWRAAIPLAVGLIVGGVLAGFGAWTLKPAPPRSVTRFSITLSDNEAFSNPNRRLVALSPDGSNLVYVADRRLYVRSLSTLQANAITGTDARNVTNPTISPDGHSVAFYTDGVLKRQMIRGGSSVPICPAANPTGMTWDERGLFFTQVGKGVLRVSPDGGTPEVIAEVGDDQGVCCPQVIAGGKALLFSQKNARDPSDTGRIVAQDLRTRVRKVLVNGTDGRYLPTGHLVYAVSGTLLAVPFDITRLAVAGGPVPIVEGIRRNPDIFSSVDAGAQFSYSTTGTLVYLPGPATAATAANVDLALFDRQGGVQPLKLTPGPYRSPRVSPDGKFVAYDTEDDRQAIVLVYELSGRSAVRRLTLEGKNRAPVWSPDAEWIAFQSDRDGDLAIFRQRADGSGIAERLTKPDAGMSHTPQTWSPDGRYLLMTVEQNTQFTLQTLRMTDRQIAPFGDVRSAIRIEASFSPDGRWVAYHSNQVRETAAGRTTQVFVQPFPPTGEKYLLPQAGSHPYWSPKGDAVIVNASASESVLVPIASTKPFAFGKPQDFARAGRFEPPVFSRRNVDAMPDGAHVIGVTAAGFEESAGARQMIVVLNWFDEVRQRVPVK